MELTVQQQKTQEFLNSIYAKCWEDSSFTKTLVAQPVQTIEKVSGRAFEGPDGKTLKVYDQTDPSVIYINIPAKPNLENMELTDAQLEAVAGGLTPAVPYIVYGGLLLIGIGLGYMSGD